MFKGGFPPAQNLGASAYEFFEFIMYPISLLVLYDIDTAWRIVLWKCVFNHPRRGVHARQNDGTSRLSHIRGSVA